MVLPSNEKTSFNAISHYHLIRFASVIIKYRIERTKSWPCLFCRSLDNSNSHFLDRTFLGAILRNEERLKDWVIFSDNDTAVYLNNWPAPNYASWKNSNNSAGNFGLQVILCCSSFAHFGQNHTLGVDLIRVDTRISRLLWLSKQWKRFFKDE